MKVAVTYAEANRQWLLNAELPEGASARDAIDKSGILSKVPHIDLSVNKIGIYSKLVPLEQVLSEGDRVEIYRPALGKPPKKERAPRPAGARSAAAEGEQGEVEA